MDASLMGVVVATTVVLFAVVLADVAPRSLPSTRSTLAASVDVSPIVSDDCAALKLPAPVRTTPSAEP